MRRAYDEIMDKLEVTPEMRRRVLEHIAAADIVPAEPKVLRFPRLKKYFAAAACLVLVIAGAAALPRVIRPQPPRGDVQSASQIQEAASLDELSALVGFAVDADFALPFEPEETTYTSYWNELAQIQYSGQGQTATYRQSVGTQDNSGDYNSYDSSAQLDLDGRTVSLRGNGGAYVLAVWTDGAYAFSLSLSDGMTPLEWSDVLR